MPKIIVVVSGMIHDDKGQVVVSDLHVFQNYNLIPLFLQGEAVKHKFPPASSPSSRWNRTRVIISNGGPVHLLIYDILQKHVRLVGVELDLLLLPFYSYGGRHLVLLTGACQCHVVATAS